VTSSESRIYNDFSRWSMKNALQSPGWSPFTVPLNRFSQQNVSFSATVKLAPVSFLITTFIFWILFYPLGSSYGLYPYSLCTSRSVSDPGCESVQQIVGQRSRYSLQHLSIGMPRESCRLFLWPSCESRLFSNS